MLVTTAFLSLLWAYFVYAKPRTVPPKNTLIVRPEGTRPGEFTTISDAVNALPADNSTQAIFIYPGTYREQVNITRVGPTTLYGFTVDDSTYENNTVLITHNASLATGAASDDLTGTLRIHQDDFSMYNINVQNTFGEAAENGQAIAISAYGNRMGLYASQFLSFQAGANQTLFTLIKERKYMQSHILRPILEKYLGLAYFEKNTIGSISAGCITANGRETNDSGIYILNGNKLVLGKDPASNTQGNVFLGRPWGDYARVIYKNTEIGSHLNPALWSIWDPGDNRTDHVLFGTWDNTGPGSVNVSLPDFATALTFQEAQNYTIETALGSDYATWVDPDYVEGC
ncbi:hypothetical protein Clacol_008478 [Clathrus columnatus]|uniref:pectinesterase n=1 Tax=Clathrus columnatus TaxID=1419009 RepID=A0AAV5AMW1_9AGAM|nr:hypothetical protein Clacol_008478 [Clathrus columnatus]